MMEQMATQMEQMSAQIAQLNHQNSLLVNEKEREWYDSQTKRMDVESKIMMTDQQLQDAVRENLMMMLNTGAAEASEANRELEVIEAGLSEEQQRAAVQSQSQPNQAAQGQRPPSPGGMTRKVDTEALTGESKPGENNE